MRAGEQGKVRKGGSGSAAGRGHGGTWKVLRGISGEDWFHGGV